MASGFHVATWDSFSVFLMCHPLSIFVFVNKGGEEKRERREKEGTEGEEEKRGEEEVGTQQGGEGRTREKTSVWIQESRVGKHMLHVHSANYGSLTQNTSRLSIIAI